MTGALNKHFVIAEDERDLAYPGADLGAGARRTRVLDLHVARGRDLRLYPVRRADGTEAGAVLGWLIDQEAGGLTPDGAEIAAPEAGADFRDWSMRFSGRFVCLLDLGDGPAFHTDPAGLLGAVRATGRGLIASTPALIDAPEDAELKAAFGVPERFGWFPFGLTPRAGVVRVHPNFSFNFNSLEEDRFWSAPPVRENSDGEAALVSAIHRATTVAATALARSALNPISAHLTAGYDSRMVLAATWPARARLVFSTIGAIPGTGADLDAAVAAIIAGRFGLAHEIRPFIESSEADRADWIARTGGCIADHVTGLAATVRSLPPGEVQLAGISGELARAFYWTAAEIGAEAPSTETLLQRIKAPARPRVFEAAEAWRATLPAMDAPRFWDMVYLEQRLGAWAGPAVYGAHQPVPSLSPFNSREIVEAMLSLPTAYRASNRFPTDFIALSEPALNAIPYNRPFGRAALADPTGWLKGMLPKDAKTRLKRLKARLKG